MRGRGARLGVKTAGGRVLAAGGASRSAAITQIAADVFGCDVLAADEPDAAALGAAFRAAHAAAGTDATRRAEITRGRGSHFTPLRRGRVDADAADAWTNRSLSSSARSTAKELAWKRPRALTSKSRRIFKVTRPGTTTTPRTRRRTSATARGCSGPTARRPPSPRRSTTGATSSSTAPSTARPSTRSSGIWRRRSRRASSGGPRSSASRARAATPSAGSTTPTPRPTAGRPSRARSATSRASPRRSTRPARATTASTRRR